MNWRRLANHELDHEVIWLSVTVLAAIFAGVWLHFAFPLPRCAWHDFTGLPCPTCGATRCVRYLTRGAWHAALLINPFVFFTLVGTAIYDLYAAVVLLLRLPRLRFDHVSARTGKFIRYSVLGVLLLNWAWLIYSGV